MNALSRLLAQFTFLRWMALMLSLPVAANAAGLNDTGITDCWNDTGVVPNSVAADGGTHPRQDCRYGRDAAAVAGSLPKTGDGSKGFDFSKIANNGSALPASAVLGSGASDWACTKDNVTGLVWEVKTTSGLRSQSHSYTWYSSNSATNGGFAGAVSGGSCQSAGRCDTEKFAADVNAAGLCGASNWRMPSRQELVSIVDYSRAYPGPTIDASYFPNTPSSYFWSASAYASGSSYAWFVDFYYGYAYNSLYKYSGFQVRLVRAGQ